MSSSILKSFNWCGDSLKRLCEHDPEFAKYLVCQTQEQRQCLALVILGWEKLGFAKFTPKELGVNIRSRSKKDLLKLLYRPYPVGLATILKKLGNRIMIKSRYLELIDLLDEPNAAKFLWHVSKIQPFMITALIGLDPAFRRPSIVASATNQSALHSFQYAIAVARRASPKASDFILAESLERKLGKPQNRNLESCEVNWVLQSWLSERLKKTSIPGPPWGGTPRLRPITNCSGILKAASDFENCLESELTKVIAKRRYFYLWKDSGEAVVALENEPLLGWILGEIKGPHNKTISKRTKEEIIKELQIAGIVEYQGAQKFDLYD